MNTINLTISNKNIRVHTWGNSTNETIIFLHGLGSSSLSCIEIAEKLKEDYYIISIDLPGHGKTETFDSLEGFEIPNLVKWIHQVVGQLVDKDYNIIAHSWGAMIALHYYSKYSKNIDKVILLDGGYHDKELTYDYFKEYNKSSNNEKQISSMEEEIEYYIDDFDNYIFDSLYDAVETEVRNHDRRSQLLDIATNDLIKYENGRYRWHVAGQTAKYAIESMNKDRTRNIYHLIGKNVLLLHSDIFLKDVRTDLRKILIEDLKSKSEINTINVEGTGHMVHWDNPDVVIKHILEFLR